MVLERNGRAPGTLAEPITQAAFKGLKGVVEVRGTCCKVNLHRAFYNTERQSIDLFCVNCNQIEVGFAVANGSGLIFMPIPPRIGGGS